MAFQRVGAYLDRALDRCTEPWFDNLAEIDWQEELRLIGTATLMVIPLVLLAWYSEKHPTEFRWISDFGNYVERQLQPMGDFIERCRDDIADALRKILPRRRPSRPPWAPHHHNQIRVFRPRGPPWTRRFSENYPYLYIWGWPSRGGVIILEHASAVDCEYLGLDHLDLFGSRAVAQADEDSFCQALLRLGAKWWDSEKRFQEIMRWRMDNLNRRRRELKHSPTTREMRETCVGYPSSGGVWIANFPSHHLFWIGVRELGHHPPDGVTVLKLARTMDERCQVLREHFEAKFYEDVSYVDEAESINSWKTKTTGEVGPLMAYSNSNNMYEAVSPGPEGWMPDSSDEDEDDEEEEENEDDE